MMGKATILASIALALLLIGAPALAHHSASEEFDTTKQFRITGVLTRLDLANPHSWWYLDIKGADGKVTHWRLESVSPNGFIRDGLKIKDDVTVGETYTFTAYPSWKDPVGYGLAQLRSIIVNGKEFLLSGD
jgi:hypothetical protein